MFFWIIYIKEWELFVWERCFLVCNDRGWKFCIVIEVYDDNDFIEFLVGFEDVNCKWVVVWVEEVMIVIVIVKGGVWERGVGGIVK